MSATAKGGAKTAAQDAAIAALLRAYGVDEEQSAGVQAKIRILLPALIAFLKSCPIEDVEKFRSKFLMKQSGAATQAGKLATEGAQAETKLGATDVKGADVKGKKQHDYMQLVAKFHADGVLPVSFLLEHAIALKNALGPMFLEQHVLHGQIADLKASPGVDAIHQETRRLHDLSGLESQMALLQQNIDVGRYQLDKLRVQSSRIVAPSIGDDGLAFERALEKLDHDGTARAKVTEIAARLSNVGELKPGMRVEVVRDGTLQAAEVIRHTTDDEYELSLWQEKSVVGKAYEVGFHTSRPIFGTFPRVAIYTDGKQPQILSDRYAILSDEVGYCLLLYRDAEKAMSTLRDISNRIKGNIDATLGRFAIQVRFAPLKPMERVMEKVVQKYRGDFSRVTDLARNVYECDDLDAVRLVLEGLQSEKAVEVVRVKNRLMPEYDATRTGGYRDVLVNLRDKSTGHIMESQIAVADLLAIKDKTGQSSYDLVRALGLAEKTRTEHRGTITHNVIQAIDSGILRVLECRGACGLQDHFDALAGALASRTCQIESLKIIGDPGWPQGKTLDDLLTPAMFMICAKRLRTLAIAYMPVGGAIPEGLWLCSKLHSLQLSETCVEGDIPQDIGNLTDCAHIYLNNTKISGDLPRTIGRCSKLEALHVGNTQLSGCIPEEIGECQRLTSLRLHGTQLAGDIPRTIGRCVKLRALELHSTQLSGLIPEEIGQCQELTSLRLHSTRLCGEIPRAIGRCVKLQTLELSRTQVHGPIREDIGHCQQLTKLLLHETQLTGEVPGETIAKLVHLNSLLLHDNPHLNISVASMQSIMQALPNAHIGWPSVKR